MRVREDIIMHRHHNSRANRERWSWVKRPQWSAVWAAPSASIFRTGQLGGRGKPLHSHTALSLGIWLSIFRHVKTLTKHCSGLRKSFRPKDVTCRRGVGGWSRVGGCMSTERKPIHFSSLGVHAAREGRNRGFRPTGTLPSTGLIGFRTMPQTCT